MGKVNVNNRSFSAIEELRGAIVRKQMQDQQAVIFVGPKAMAEMNTEKMRDAIVVGEGVWGKWPRVVAVRIDGELRSSEKAANGEEMFFYELD